MSHEHVELRTGAYADSVALLQVSRDVDAVPGVLAATCHDVRTAKNSREHNGANVLCLGSGTLDLPAALQVLDAWLDTPFGGGRHGRRVDKIKALERSFCK